MKTSPLILCVDDEQAFTNIVGIHLREAGYEVVVASCGQEALQIAHACKPDLILLDLMLPDVDGFSVCEILRAGKRTARIPIIFVTAWITDEARKVGRELGGVDYLTKPFRPGQLLASVKRSLDTPPQIPPSNPRRPVASSDRKKGHASSRSEPKTDAGGMLASPAGGG